MGTPSHPNRTVRVKDLNRFKQNLESQGISGLKDVSYDTSEKKLTKTLGDSTSDVATAKRIASDGMDGMNVTLTTTQEGSDTVKTFTFS